MKYVGIWWEMHIGKASWEYSDGQNPYWEVDKKPNGRHGANTQNTKRYIDFAAANGFDGVLVEGWNVGWEDWFGKWKEDVFDFVTPYPDFDVAEVSAYAKAKGVSMIMHHETSGSVTNYERQMDTAFRFMNLWGYPAVKSGYVGNIIPRGEHHDGQWMIRHYTRAAQKSASYNIMINSHESARLTGLHRTYPNYLAAEAARGQEFNAWSKGNAPDHETILPFTRIMGGPMDYTPGIFRIALNQYDSNKTERVHTTLVKQLALYVVLYSPLQMAADLPENYEAKPDAFKFIKDVAVDWDDTKVLRAEPGDYIITARKAKGSNTWFMGGITDENARTFDLKLDFLDKDKTYTMTVYADAPDADYERNAEAYVISTKKVKATDVLKVKMARSGGVAVSFTAN